MDIETMYEQLGVSRAVYEYGESVLRDLRPRFDAIDQTAEINQGKVLHAMQKNKVNATHFAATTGYGYDDEGRDNLERVYADVFHTEAALVRPQITCGTHALAVALSANLLPGDELLSPVGAPYDTLEEVIGIRPSKCSLMEYGVTYAQADLKPDGSFDYDAIRSKINDRTKLITIQRSKGYATRPSFGVEQIGELIAFCKGIKPDVKVMVDNCYGEFVETLEPSDLGADMVVGSLIKNPGGGLAPIGGYICGTKECVERCAYRLSAPGLGQEVGANLGLMTSLYQGLFLSPTVVSGALKGAIFAANIYEKLGFACVPGAAEDRHDIIQAVTLGKESSFLADLTIRHPQNDNAELLWHCGPFPYSLKDSGCQARLVGGQERFELKKGDITVCRFDDCDGKYYLFGGEGRAVDGPQTNGTYVWFETGNWKRWEEKLMFGPYIHHVGGIYGNYKPVLREAARYLGLIFDDADEQGVYSL